jgi:sigma-E factor negative regulatory protein RseC
LIEQQARVINSNGAMVSVRIGGQSGCSACDEGRGCGAGVFGKLLKRHPVELDVANEIGARTGQAVQLGISESLFLRLVFRRYGRPLAGGLAGAAVAHALATSAGAGAGILDLATIAGAVLGAAVVLIFWNMASKPDISSGDIHLLEIPDTEPECGAGKFN